MTYTEFEWPSILTFVKLLCCATPLHLFIITLKWVRHLLSVLNCDVTLASSAELISLFGLLACDVSTCYELQGRIQDFIKEGMPKLRTDRTSMPVGTGGVWGGCAPSETKKICNFSKLIRTIWCILFAWGANTKSGALSLQKIIE